MDNHWEELIPLYVAGLLSKEEQTQVENILKKSEYARQLVEEWTWIARGVKEEASSRARELPPLSPLIRAQIRSDKTAQTAVSLPTLKAQRLRRQSGFRLTWVAAVIVIAFIAGLIVWAFNRDNRGQFASTIEATVLPTAAPDVDPHQFVVGNSLDHIFTETLSAPDGDRSDQVVMIITDMNPGEERTLTVSLNCTGNGIENLIWQIGRAKVNGCGTSIYTGVTSESNEVIFNLYFEGSQTASVIYTLTATESN